jgi:hypothetical protein
MKIHDAVEKSIIDNLGFKELELTPAQKLQLRNASAAACAIVMQHVANNNQPLALFVDRMCEALDIDSTWLRQPSKRGDVSHFRAAIQWLLRRGIDWGLRPIPSLAEISCATRYMDPRHRDRHSAVFQNVERAEVHARTQQLVRVLLDYCDANGIKTHPRPDWAKEAA